MSDAAASATATGLVRLDALDNHHVRMRDRTWDDHGEIIAFLRTQTVAHVAVHDDPYPYVLPQTYQIDFTDGQLTFLLHFARNGRIGQLVRARPTLTIVVDEVTSLLTGPAADESSLEYHSVLARCNAELSFDLDCLEAHQYRVLDKYRSERDYTDIDRNWLKPLVAVRAVASEITAKTRSLDDPRSSPGSYRRHELQSAASPRCK